MSRFETVLLALFLACWLAWLLYLAGLVPLAGALNLTLYKVYGWTAAFGWLFGNVYVHRVRKLPELKLFLLPIYFFGPYGMVLLLWAMAPPALRAAAPVVPLYALAVLGIFFLVPVTLRPRPPS